MGPNHDRRIVTNRFMRPRGPRVLRGRLGCRRSGPAGTSMRESANHDYIQPFPYMQAGGTDMIGMDFVSFLILLVISVVVSGALHYWLEYYVTPGIWSFVSKVIVGWVGAWLGSVM